MSTDTTQSSDELDEFHRYINDFHDGSFNGHTIDEAIEEFKEHQRQLAELREKVRKSEESAEREGTQPLTKQRLEAMLAEEDKKLREEGILK